MKQILLCTLPVLFTCSIAAAATDNSPNISELGNIEPPSASEMVAASQPDQTDEPASIMEKLGKGEQQVKETREKNKQADKRHYSLLGIYKLAYENNGHFQAQVAKFRSKKQQVPISLGNLLPTLTLNYNYQGNYTNPVVFTANNTYVSRGPELSASQVLFDWSAWKTYTAAQYQVKAQAIALAQAQQKLIADTVKQYFSVLNSRQQLDYARASERWNRNLYEQTRQRYKVGLAPVSDLQSSKAQYQEAVARTVKERNDLLSAIYNLKKLTGVEIDNVEQLKSSFPFNPPQPNRVNHWLGVAMKENLEIVRDRFMLKAAEEKISMAWGQFFPSVAATGQLSRTTSFQEPDDRTGDAEALQPIQGTGGITASWNLLNGGADYAKVKQNKHLRDNAGFTLEQAKLTTESQLKQAFLSVESDIARINSFRQAVVAGQYSVKTMKAQYEVGTSTIVDLLNQQQRLLASQQRLADAKFQYINDLIKLKQESGILTMNDIRQINQWLTGPGANKAADKGALGGKVTAPGKTGKSGSSQQGKSGKQTGTPSSASMSIYSQPPRQSSS